MRRYLIALCFASVLSLFIGCTFSQGTTEQCVVELPKGHPDTNIATAQQICQQVIASDIAARVRGRFPALTEQQLRGIILRPMSGNFPKAVRAYSS